MQIRNNIAILTNIHTKQIGNNTDNEFLNGMYRIYGNTENQKNIDLGFYKPENMFIDLDTLIGLTISEAVDSIMHSKQKAAQMLNLLEK